MIIQMPLLGGFNGGVIFRKNGVLSLTFPSVLLKWCTRINNPAQSDPSRQYPAVIEQGDPT